MRRNGSSSFAIGAFILVVGVALFLDRSGLLPWTSKWSVWPLLLIAFGVMHLIDGSLGGLFPMALGAWIWAGQAGALSLTATWPLLLVVFGLALMVETWVGSPRRPPVTDDRQRSPVVALAITGAIFAATAIDSHNYIVNHQDGRSTHSNSIAALGARIERVTGDTPFTGGQVAAIVGVSTLDLRRARVADRADVIVDVGVFGGSAIVEVPDGWTVDVQTVPVLGRVLDRRGQPDASTRVQRRGRLRAPDTWDQAQTPPVAAPPTAALATAGGDARLVLTGSVVFGSLVIR